MRLLLGDDLHEDVRATMTSVGEEVERLGGSAAFPDAAVAVGAVGRESVGEIDGALVLVPVLGPHAPGPGPERRVLARADCLGLLAAEDYLAMASQPPRRPIVGLGVPRPGPSHESAGAGVDTDDGDGGLRAVWAARSRDHAPDLARVTWVGGVGGWRLARALAAIAASRAVVTLPDPFGLDPRLDGAVMPARRALEVVEATDLLVRNPVLARALAAAGRKRLDALPSATTVALRLLEALQLAQEHHARTSVRTQRDSALGTPR